MPPTKSWAACTDAQYFQNNGYEKFLFDLYGCQYNAGAPVFTAAGALQARVPQSLLRQEADLAFPTAPSVHWEISGAAARRQAMATSAFSTNGFGNGTTVAPNHGWTYLEVAYRVRMLFAALYKVARENIPLDSVNPNAPEDPNYIQKFFQTIAPETTLLNSIFPPKIRTMLATNQSIVRNTILKNVSAQNALNNPGTSDLMDRNFFAHLTTEDATSATRELAVPYSHAHVTGSQEGPIGPVSIEVAFILALQFAGIDLTRLARARSSVSTDPPSILTGAQLPSTHSTIIPAVPLVTADPCGIARFGKNHSTIFRDPVRTGGSLLQTIGIGFYCAIDIYEGLAATLLAKAVTAAQVWALPLTGRGDDVFAFSMHAVDAATVETKWTDNNVDPLLRNTDRANWANLENAARNMYVYQRTGDSPAKPGVGDAGAAARRYATPGQFAGPNAALPVVLSGASASPRDAPLATAAPAVTTVNAHCHQGWWTRADFNTYFNAQPGLTNHAVGLPQYVQARKSHIYLMAETRNNVHPRVARQVFA